MTDFFKSIQSKFSALPPMYRHAVMAVVGFTCGVVTIEMSGLCLVFGLIAGYLYATKRAGG